MLARATAVFAGAARAGALSRPAFAAPIGVSWMSSAPSVASAAAARLTEHERSLFIDPAAPQLPRKIDQGFRFGVQPDEIAVRWSLGCIPLSEILCVCAFAGLSHGAVHGGGCLFGRCESPPLAG